MSFFRFTSSCTGALSTYSGNLFSFQHISIFFLLVLEWASTIIFLEYAKGLCIFVLSRRFFTKAPRRWRRRFYSWYKNIALLATRHANYSRKLVEDASIVRIVFLLNLEL
jgi:hypothetical protein